MERSGVALGFTRKPSRSWSDFPSKAGGAPVWLDPQNLPPMADACCGFCKEPLQFLLQVCVPLPEGDDENRFTLLVFMCPKMACLNLDQAQQSQETSHRSVKVFRAQVAARRNDPNGVQLCDWCHTWKGGSQCGGCRKISYCSRKHQVEHWQAGHSYSCKDSSSDKRAEKKTLWHEFELEFSEEEGSEEEEEDEEAADADDPGIVPATNLEGFQEASREDSFWAAFQARMTRAPSQVLRLGSSRAGDSQPLWMKLEGQASDADIPSCQLCGAPRVFEFQVMSQLLYFFGVENERDSLDWGTIAVYSCRDSCPAEGYVQEFAWVQSSP
ncbi:programmed cell death protein 2 [Selaginella moellendorffii]|nr:programmed cell death protein 2 [Selaginella moellendorffii]|eukprot:XP_024535147.1 programmed cell death protein 2 [Selaginella moellendorffii]